MWPNAVLRGDHGGVRLREGSNVQDGAVCHEGVDVGPYATVGHNAIVHGATLERRALVGMGAIVLDDSVVGERALVGANSLVTEGTEIPPNALATGTPAEVRTEVEDSPWTQAGDVYVGLSERHESTSETLTSSGRRRTRIEREIGDSAVSRTDLCRPSPLVVDPAREVTGRPLQESVSAVGHEVGPRPPAFEVDRAALDERLDAVRPEVGDVDDPSATQGGVHRRRYRLGLSPDRVYVHSMLLVTAGNESHPPGAKVEMASWGVLGPV